MRKVPFGVVALVVFALAVPAAAHEQEDAPKPKIAFDASNRDFTQRHLTISVKPDMENGTISGWVKIRFAPLVDDFETLRLHCEDTTVHAVKDPQGNFLAKRLEHGLLFVTMRAPLQRGEEGTVIVEYTSKPTRGLYFHKPSHACPNRPTHMYSQGQGKDNRRWIPCYDHPDDRCSWDMHVEVAKTLTTVSNGVLVDQKDLGNGQRSDHWHFGSRSPTYLISLIVGTFETIKEKWEDVDLVYNGPPGRREELQRALDKTPEMMAFFSDYTGFKYPWPSYTQTFVWDFIYGGMENVTCTTLNMRALHTDKARPNYRSDGLVAHELAHMWFGDLMTCRTWEHLWLNEGFATYFTDLFFEHDFGRDEFLLRRRNQNQRYMSGTPTPSKLGLTVSPRGDVPIELMGGKAYTRGAAILHMLRKELGDDVFRGGIRHYVKRHQDQAVVSEQLRRCMEEVAGRDLEWFWDQWVYGSGYPKLDVEVSYEWAGQATVRVKQKQPRTGGQSLFRINVPVRVGSNGKVTDLRIYREKHTFFLPYEPSGNAETTNEMFPFVRFGVDGDLLMEVNLSYAEKGQAFHRAALALDPDYTGRMDAALALEQYGETAVTSVAWGLANDPSWSVRETCAKVLGRLGGGAAAMALLPATEDKDPRVRVAVVQALGGMSRKTAGPALTRMVQDPHPYVVSEVARALGKLKVPDALKMFEVLLAVDSHEDVVQQGAIDGLRNLGDPAGIELAKPFMRYVCGEGGTHRIRQKALACVMALGPDDPGVHAWLVAQLDDPFHRVRQSVCEACGTYGVKAALPKLKKIAEHDWNGGVRNAAQKAIEALQ